VASTLRRARFGGPQVRPPIPFIVKINHNELMTLPEQVRPDHVRLRSEQASTWARWRGRDDLLRLARVGRQIVEIAEAFAEAHQLGMFTVLWCYLRNNGFKKANGGLSHRPPT
jgi:class I fructose-bisphosphate aldolase